MGHFQNLFFASLSFEPIPSVEEWAERNVILPRHVSTMPGYYRAISYQHGFYEAIDDPTVEVIVLMTSSQVGKSEFLVVAALYFACADPSRILFVQPKDEAAFEFKDERFTPVIENSPGVREELAGYFGQKGYDTEGNLTFPGGFINFKGAGSPTNLAGKPIRVLLMDEIDRYEGSIGGEGDAVTLASKRTATEHTRKILLASTPKDKARSRIERLYEQTDQRKYFVTCPECAHEQLLEFDLDRESITRTKDRGTCYVCVNCGSLLDQGQVKRMVASGVWRPTSDTPRKGWVGFHISELYSPFSSLEKVLAQWDGAEGDAMEEQGFTNTVLGIPWEGHLFQKKSPRTLYERREDIDTMSLPPGIGCLTAGVDVQGDRVEIGFFGWGIDDERWFLGIERLYGDVRGIGLWGRVTEVLRQSFRHSAGVIMRTEAVCIDAGFSTQTVVDYVERAKAANLNYYAILGRAGEGRPLWQLLRSDVARPGKLYAIGVDEGKTELYMALAKEHPGPGYVHLSTSLDEGMIEQLVAEICKEEVNLHGMSKRTWELPKRKRNEALDIAVYAHAAYKSLGIDIANRLEMLYGPQVPPADLGAIAKSFMGKQSE
jgi:phage terminase large subunit GpA-like protein